MSCSIWSHLNTLVALEYSSCTWTLTWNVSNFHPKIEDVEKSKRFDLRFKCLGARVARATGPTATVAIEVAHELCVRLGPQRLWPLRCARVETSNIWMKQLDFQVFGGPKIQKFVQKFEKSRFLDFWVRKNLKINSSYRFADFLIPKIRKPHFV